MSKRTGTIQIQTLKRFSGEHSEQLEFEAGTNVLVGPPNSGKSKWLSMLDYLLGDRGSAEDALGDDLVEKYDRAQLTCMIGGEVLIIERRWKEKGAKGKIFVNDEVVAADNFTEFIFGKLDFPVLHYPQGNPFSERSWPELGWRSIYRHMYRQERFWNDLADKQPASEQHACLMFFLGLAEHLFPPELGELIDMVKEKDSLRNQKVQFMETLSEISREIGRAEEIGVAPTFQSIDDVIEKEKLAITSLEASRESIISAFVKTNVVNDGSSELDELRESWTRLQSQLERMIGERRVIANRKAELLEYRESIAAESERINRVVASGRILADIKVTHCPVCDQKVLQQEKKDNHCFLCHQVYDAGTASTKRIDFEKHQVDEELVELDQLIEDVQSEEAAVLASIEIIEEKQMDLEVLLRPVRSAAAAIIHPEIALQDREIGKISERIKYLEGIKGALLVREKLTEKITTLDSKLHKLQHEVDSISEKANFEEPADVLADGMNTYLNAISVGALSRWPESHVSVRLSERSSSLSVGKSHWSKKLGGTLTAYFLMAYHYALLELTTKESYRYPGLVILDFPVTFADGEEVADKENYLIEPFIALQQRHPDRNLQLIAAGRSFKNLANSHRNELFQVWK